MSFDKQHVMGAAAEATEPALVSDQARAGLDPTGFDQAQVIPGALTVGEVPTWVEIDPAEYVRRREDERASAAHSLAIHGSWEAVAAIMMETMVYMAPASHQWGSHHHQLAIAVAALRNRAEPLAAPSRQEERLSDVLQTLCDCVEQVLPPAEHETITVPIPKTFLGHGQAFTTSTIVKLSVRGKDVGAARSALTRARAALEPPHAKDAADV